MKKTFVFHLICIIISASAYAKSFYHKIECFNGFCSMTTYSEGILWDSDEGIVNFEKNGNRYVGLAMSESYVLDMYFYPNRELLDVVNVDGIHKYWTCRKQTQKGNSIVFICK